MSSDSRPLVSIVIKALNEEKHIAAAIESALAALDEVGGEVILADSASTDRTIEIARRYPIKIVTLNSADDRSCGAGGQLGFQHSRGRYIYLIDGDMKMRRGFLPAAIRYLEGHGAVAGVGGILTEHERHNREFVQRVQRGELSIRPGTALRLDGGGLYRRSAIESVGYFTDRNLHGGEETELGARLRARGWTLARIVVPAVDHRGHAGNAYRLLLRRITSRGAWGSGESVRAAFGRAHFPLIFQENNTLKLCFAVHGWWLSMLACLFLIKSWPLAIAAMLGVLLLPVAAMSLRWRSLSVGLYSVAAWNTYAICFLPGLLRRRVSPTAWIESSVIKDVPVLSELKAG
ncbi:MAG: glycosyltransferase [Rhizobiales bacterium]|nr:glycosyltransferase [Hyphomicrobiales bacterium]